MKKTTPMISLEHMISSQNILILIASKIHSPRGIDVNDSCQSKHAWFEAVENRKLISICHVLGLGLAVIIINFTHFVFNVGDNSTAITGSVGYNGLKSQ